MRAVRHSCARAIDAWHDALSSEARQKELLTNALTRMLHQQVAKALDTWLVAARERARMQKYAGRLLQAALVRAWYNWVEVRRRPPRRHPHARCQGPAAAASPETPVCAPRPRSTPTASDRTRCAFGRSSSG